MRNPDFTGMLFYIIGFYIIAKIGFCNKSVRLSELKNVRIVIFFLFFLIAAFVSLAGRCLYLQYFRSEHYIDLSEKTQRILVPQMPQRGVILDCRARVLAASPKIQTIFADPKEIINIEDVSVKLSKILNMDAREIYRLISESKNPRFVKIKTGVSQDECKAVSKIVGIGVQSDWYRNYPMGRLVSHVVGFISKDNYGFGGVELQFDKELRGSSGQDVFFADISRRPIKFKEQTRELRDGTGLILTIDSAIQAFTRDELMEQYKAYQAESAVAIVMDPYTGAVLAMVSLPDYDPNEFSSTETDHLKNRAITDEFEPGSVIKPMIAAIALDANAISRNTVIDCENGSYHGKGFGTISEYSNHRYGSMTVKGILIHSSNIGMAKIGQKLGKNKLYAGLKLFGFGEKTGLDLPGEADGLVWPASRWTGYSVTRIPFGQEITVTAMQLIRSFAIIANGGKSVKPYLVKAAVDKDGHIVKFRQPTPPVGYIIRPEIAKWLVTEALTDVVNEGTGKPAKLEKWQVFGKTGTANIAQANVRGYSGDNYMASFLAGAPAENPRIVVLVSVRKPNKKLGKGYTGGAVAAPVAGKIIEKTLTYLENNNL